MKAELALVIMVAATVVLATVLYFAIRWMVTGR